MADARAEVQRGGAAPEEPRRGERAVGRSSPPPPSGGSPSSAAPSRLPVHRPRQKRPPRSENEAPPERPSKRFRGPTAAAKRGSAASAASGPKPPSAAFGGHGGHPTGRQRVPFREVGTTSGAAVTQPPPSVSAAQTGAKKRPAWDLKGQLSDLRAKENTYREKIQGLTAEKQILEHHLAEQRQQLEEAVAQNKELTGRTSRLSSELHVCQEEARERLQRLTVLLAKEKQLEEALQNQTRLNGELREAQVEAEGLNRDLVARMEAREAELCSAQVSLVWHQKDAEKLRARLTEQEQYLHQLEMERRILHNTVQELKGNIRVFCRVRPLLTCEKDAQKGMGHLRFPPGDRNSLVICKAEESHVGRERKDDITYEFSFDRVFPPSSSQKEVFEEIALLVQSALDGYHVCIFAYGQTGSGKTYTMEGPEERGAETVGLIPRAVQQVFRASREMEGKGWKYCFSANFLEIYNENLRDLLVPRPERSSELEIRRVSQCTEELHVPGLSCIPVASEEEVLKLLRRAQTHRSVAKTTLNERSSRSHSLFQLRIEGHSASQDLRTSSVLSLVDLAGSERLDKSLSQGERLKETQAINSSLSNLGLVIMALSNKESHVPYRNSKLTYLLQNSLGGNSKMLMFVNISPLEENLAESLNSLRFAKKVNECVIGTAQANRK